MQNKRQYFIYEIEGSKVPVFPLGEWEELSNLTATLEESQEHNVVAYGEISGDRYIALYETK